MDQAIRTAMEDISIDRVSNWCEHIRARQVSVSFLGQAMGLPIGPKEVSCSEVGGSYQGMTYKGVAELFINSNCVGCPFHVLKNADNIGQEIVDAARSEVAQEEADSTALRDLTVEGIDLDGLLEADIQSDSQVKSLVALLADPERKAGAAAKLREVARYFPDRVSLLAGKAMTRAFRDPQVGDVVIEAVILLLPRHGDDLLAEAAAAVRRTSLHVSEGAKIIDTALAEGVLQPDLELAQELLLQLAPLIDTFEFRHSGRPDTSDVSQAFRRLAELNFDAAAQAAGQALLDEHAPHLREKGAAAVAELLLVDPRRTSAEFVRPLIHGLSFLEGELETDASLAVALAKCIAVNPVDVADVIFDVMPSVDESTKTSALTAFLRDEAMEADETPWMPRLIGLLTDRSIGDDVRRHLVDHLERAARCWPDKFWGHFELLLGTLAQVADEAEAVRKRLEESPETTLEALERQSNAIAASSSVRDLGKVVAWTGLENPDAAIAVIDDLLRNTDSRLAGSFKAALVRSLGEMGRQAKSVAPKLVPIIHPHLIDPVSHAVRAAALDACQELVDWNRDVLPEDTILLAATLLGDQYLSPVAVSAVGVFHRAKVDDLWLATVVTNMLYRLYRVYGDSPSYGSVREVAWALSNLAGQHESLEGPIARILSEMSSHRDYYAAKDAVETYGRFARRREACQLAYFEVLINFLERFGLIASLPGYQYLEGHTSDLFENFYHLKPEVVRSHASHLVRFAVESKEERNMLHVGSLLMALGLDEQAADLFDVLAKALPSERRNEWLVKKCQGLAKALRAERAVSDGKLSDANQLFQEARELFALACPTKRRLPFNLGDVDDEHPFYEGWVDLRARWLELPDAAEDLEHDAAELADAATSLAEHDLEERDSAIVRMAALLCTASARVGRWWTLVRSADPMSAPTRDSALACLAEAAEAANLIEGEEGASRVRLIMKSVEALSPTAGQSGIRDVAARVRACPLPLPRYELPVPRGWQRRRARDVQKGGEEGELDQAPLIAVASITINGEEPPPVFEAISQRTYDIEVTLDVANAPAGTIQLELGAVSSLRQDHYQFPQATISLAPDGGAVVHAGTMLFVYPQSEGSQPLSVKLLASLVNNDGERTDVALLGRHELGVRVHRDVERYRARGPAAPQAVEKLRAELDALVPSGRDPNRQDELEVIEALVGFMERQLRTPSLKGKISEKRFESQLKNDLDIRFEGRDDVYSQIKTGAGFVDCLVLGVPVELKVFDGDNLDQFIDSSLPQATQYTVTQSRRAGFLVILDCGEHAEPTPALVNDVQVRQGATSEGLEDVPDGVITVGVMVVRTLSTVPSRLRPPADTDS